MLYLVFISAVSFLLGRLTDFNRADIKSLNKRCSDLEQDVDEWRSKYFKCTLDFGEYRAQHGNK